MEKNKVWVLMEGGEPIAVCLNRADIEELFMDIVMEAQYNTFCWNWLYLEDSLELCLKYSENNDSYWITDTIVWR